LLFTGPSPSTISTPAGFNRPGIYKLWFQFQRSGKVSTVSWVLRVLPPAGSRPAVIDSTKNAILVQFSSAGFTPSRIVVPANRAARLAFRRVDAQNCAREVVIPEIGVRKNLPPGQTVIIDVPVMPPRKLHFACGMGMYKGAIVLN
jgi:plastocyanin domain-containing protein